MKLRNRVGNQRDNRHDDERRSQRSIRIAKAGAWSPEPENLRVVGAVLARHRISMSSRGPLGTAGRRRGPTRLAGRACPLVPAQLATVPR